MSDQPHAGGGPGAAHRRRLALVLWNGDVGGAEVLNLKLAERLRRLEADVTIVFVGTPWPLAQRLAEVDIPHRSLDMGRGRNVFCHPRRYAREVAQVGPDGALLMERGFMAAVLRIGGYRGPIVAVEHGALLGERNSRATLPRWLRELGRVAGAWADDAEIAVSDFMLAEMRRRAHAHTTMRIYNGIDPDVYSQAEDGQPGDVDPHDEHHESQFAGDADSHDGRSESELVVGFAGRLVPGKGAEHLIGAMAHVPATLLIAGDGPERASLTDRTRELGLTDKVRFLGVVGDMPAFWRECDVVAVPSQAWESFSMATLEAMSCGKAIVAARSGAIPELVLDGVTGTLVPPGDIQALAQALTRYAERPELRAAHGRAARARAGERFHIADCAQAYVELFDELATRRSGRRRSPRARLERPLRGA